MLSVSLCNEGYEPAIVHLVANRREARVVVQQMVTELTSEAGDENWRVITRKTDSVVVQSTYERTIIICVQKES